MMRRKNYRTKIGDLDEECVLCDIKNINLIEDILMDSSKLYFLGIRFKHWFKDTVATRGRVGRKEFLVTQTILVGLLVGIITFLIWSGMHGEKGSAMTRGYYLGPLWIIPMLLPFCNAARRLHDMNRSGGYVFLFLVLWLLGSYVQYLSYILLFLLYVLPGTKGKNKYGEEPSSRLPSKTTDLEGSSTNN